MVPEINKILYATDLSENARHAFGYAADLAKRYNALVTILYVMEDINHIAEIQIMEYMGEDEWSKLKSQKQDYLTQKIKSRIEDFCRQMDSHIDSCRLLVEEILITKGKPDRKNTQYLKGYKSRYDCNGKLRS